MRQKILKFKYKHFKKKISVVACWAKWCVIPCLFAHKFKNNQPLIIEYLDHNGEYSYYIEHPWYCTTTGHTIAYFFNEVDAKTLANLLNKAQGLTRND